MIEQTVVCPAVNKKFLSTGLCSSDQVMPHLNLIITLPYATLADTLTCFLGKAVVHIKYHILSDSMSKSYEIAKSWSALNRSIISIPLTHPCSYLGDVNLLVMN